jgi:hypothetical protein
MIVMVAKSCQPILLPFSGVMPENFVVLGNAPYQVQTNVTNDLTFNGGKVDINGKHFNS